MCVSGICSDTNTPEKCFGRQHCYVPAQMSDTIINAVKFLCTVNNRKFGSESLEHVCVCVCVCVGV